MKRLPFAVKLMSALLCLGLVAGTLFLVQSESSTASRTSNVIAYRAKKRLPIRWRVAVRPARYRVGGFSRSQQCPNDGSMMAIVPPTRSEEMKGQADSAVDRTISAHPTFWVQVPAMATPTEAQFTLQDAAGKKQLYSTRLQLSGKSGIVGIRIPTSVPDLKVGESYFWQIATACDPNDSNSEMLAIGSWIQRVALSQLPADGTFNPKPMVQELATAGDRDKPRLYAELGIWQDAFSSLAQLRRQNPQDKEVQEAWRELLAGAQMPHLANQPILQVK